MADQKIELGDLLRHVLQDKPISAGAPRCQWCGRYTKELRTYQPPTEAYKLDPDDPEGLCDRCYDKAVR